MTSFQDCECSMLLFTEARAAAPWISGDPAEVEEAEEAALLPSTSVREGANLLCRIIISALTDAKQFCAYGEGRIQQ